MHAYIPTKEELEEIIARCVKKNIAEALPRAIRKGTRKKWLTTDEVMELLQCSRRHIQYLRDSEQLPYAQNGRTIRYDIDDIETFLRNHKTKARLFKRGGGDHDEF